MIDNDDWDETPNPYSAPLSLPRVAVDPDEDFETQELRAIIGSRSAYYLRKWASLLKGQGGTGGFNWAAFFFCGLWLGYRKMYRFTFIFYGFIIVESIIQELLFLGVFTETSPPMIDSIIGLIAAMVCGKFGNEWYLSHARKVISQVRAEGLGSDAQLEILSERGGTNLAASIGLTVLFCAVMFVLLVVLEFVLLPGAAP